MLPTHPRVDLVGDPAKPNLDMLLNRLLNDNTLFFSSAVIILFCIRYIKRTHATK